MLNDVVTDSSIVYFIVIFLNRAYMVRTAQYAGNFCELRVLGFGRPSGPQM